MIEIVEKFVESVKRGQAEIYNEFSVQHEMGILLRSQFPNQKVQFERNVSFFFGAGKFIKKGPSGFSVGYTVRLPFPLIGSVPFVLSLSKDERGSAQALRQAQGERIQNRFG